MTSDRPGHVTGRLTAPPRRHRTVVDTSELARRIGGRLKAARLRAGLTQQQLAEGRYTKAYVSALENGLVKPSMAALDFFADRLGIPASALMSGEVPAWSRLEADLLLAAGRWQGALDAYRALLESATERTQRAEILVGVAEALVRLDRGAEASAAAAEAAEVFAALGRVADAARADYWLAGAQYELENSAEAKSLLGSILTSVRGGLVVEPRFHLRILMALAAVEARDGDHGAALAYLEEVRGLEGELDDRRRATFLFDLAHSYRETGDIEAAIRTGHQGLELFRELEAEAEMGALENDLALAFLALPNVARAGRYAASARLRFERLRDERWLAHVAETEARIALAQGNPERALDLASEALALAERTSNQKAAIDALVAGAKAEYALGRSDAADASFERAAELARTSARPGRLREVLAEWADLLAQLGEHRRAYEVSREALHTG